MTMEFTDPQDSLLTKGTIVFATILLSSIGVSEASFSFRHGTLVAWKYTADELIVAADSRVTGNATEVIADKKQKTPQSQRLQEI
jgi:hypothetical protein